MYVVRRPRKLVTPSPVMAVIEKHVVAYPPLSAFPVTLPTVYVSGDDSKKPYGLADRTSRAVKQEIKSFVKWSTVGIQLDRSERYGAAVQTTTTDKHETCMKAYLGYIVNIQASTFAEDISISAYSSPTSFISFISYLKARGVQRGHIIKHISLARKVNNYLISGSATTSQQTSHGGNIETWLGRLESQISATMPKEPKSFVPSLKDLYLWVDDLIEGAEEMTSADLNSIGTLTAISAWQNQAALMAALTVGRFQPPIRLSIERTLLHPSHETNKDGRRGQQKVCMDPDCRTTGCLGNRLVVVGDLPDDDSELGDTRTIQFIAPHHKTERKGFSAITFTLPEGIFTKLLLLHIDYGHKLLTQFTGDHMPFLFATKSGKQFSAANFTQYWGILMKSAKDIPYFPPSLARTSFVDSYTSLFGEEPDAWEGAATVMGNTVKMWNEMYNPLKRGREAQDAVDRHVDFAERVKKS